MYYSRGTVHVNYSVLHYFNKFLIQRLKNNFHCTEDYKSFSIKLSTNTLNDVSLSFFLNYLENSDDENHGTTKGRSGNTNRCQF